MTTAILGYGVYIPKYRIKIAEIASVWGKKSSEIENSLGLTEKSVASADEDAVTMAYEAAYLAIKRAEIKPSELQVCLVGSESHPYAVNPTSTIVAEFLGVGRNYIASDLEFACKAGTTGIIAVAGLIGSGKVEFGLVIGSDKAQAKPHDVLEYTAASAAAAYVLGKSSGKKDIATIRDSFSFSSDTPDLWRRDGVRFPSHGGRFTEEPGYFSHIEGASKGLLQKTGLKPDDFDYCIFHMPNGKFPREVAKRLGFTNKQLANSLTVDAIGNPYSASCLIGLSQVLDRAKPNELIFMASYGSGAGSDAFMIKTGTGIDLNRKQNKSFEEYMKGKKYITYVDFLRKGGKI
jgi:hydroxymethylglutaryl-CoA synthase